MENSDESLKVLMLRYPVNPFLVEMGLPRSLLKFSGGSGDDYATFSASFPTSPSC